MKGKVAVIGTWSSPFQDALLEFLGGSPKTRGSGYLRELTGFFAIKWGLFVARVIQVVPLPNYDYLQLRNQRTWFDPQNEFDVIIYLGHKPTNQLGYPNVPAVFGYYDYIGGVDHKLCYVQVDEFPEPFSPQRLQTLGNLRYIIHELRHGKHFQEGYHDTTHPAKFTLYTDYFEETTGEDWILSGDKEELI